MQISRGGHLEKQNGRQKWQKTGFAPDENTDPIINIFYRVIAL